jgi:hypothetical protein
MTLIKKMWEISWDMWEHRNGKLHVPYSGDRFCNNWLSGPVVEGKGYGSALLSRVHFLLSSIVRRSGTRSGRYPQGALCESVLLQVGLGVRRYSCWDNPQQNDLAFGICSRHESCLWWGPCLLVC